MGKIEIGGIQVSHARCAGCRRKLKVTDPARCVDCAATPRCPLTAKLAGEAEGRGR